MLKIIKILQDIAKERGYAVYKVKTDAVFMSRDGINLEDELIGSDLEFSVAPLGVAVSPKNKRTVLVESFSLGDYDNDNVEELIQSEFDRIDRDLDRDFGKDEDEDYGSPWVEDLAKLRGN